MVAQSGTTRRILVIAFTRILVKVQDDTKSNDIINVVLSEVPILRPSDACPARGYRVK